MNTANIEKFFERADINYKKIEDNVYSAGFPGETHLYDVWIRLTEGWVFFFIGPLTATVYGLIRVLMSNSATGPMALIGLIALGFAVIMSSGSFVITLRRFFCSKCVNFSCPLNTVSKPLVDSYLKNNDIMREAWVRSGYRLGTSDEDGRMSG